METEYLGYKVINGVFVKDLELEGEPERLNKPFGYLLKNMSRYNVNARLKALYEAQEKSGHDISKYAALGYKQMQLDEEYKYHCIVDAITELVAYKSTQDNCALEGDPDYRIY